MGYCYNCGAEIHKRVYRSTVCPSCDRDVKVCYNCRFYAPTAHWECYETIPEPVKEKDRANFCDYFSLSGEGRNTAKNEKKDSARKAFDDLFS